MANKLLHVNLKGENYSLAVSFETGIWGKPYMYISLNFIHFYYTFQMECIELQSDFQITEK